MVEHILSLMNNKKVSLLKSSVVFGEIVYATTLLAIALVILFLIILTKSKTAPDFLLHPVLYSYTIFVTLFQLGRLSASLFYRQSLRSVTKNLPALAYEPTVTFVVPCKNEENAIRNTITKCFEANYPKNKIEVIVINDGSTDKTIDILNELKKNFFKDLIIVDWKVNKGKREGMAEGFRRAKGEIVVQLDSDSFIDPKSFRNLITPFVNPEIGAVCAHADPENADENIITRMQSAYYFLSFRVMKAAESTFFSVFCCSGCSSAYRKSAVMPILDKWLNESFMGTKVTYGDDRSLTCWILKGGLKTIYTDEVQAYTIVPNNRRQLFKQQLRWKKSWIINAFLTSGFIFKTDPFVAVLYFLPLVIISFLTPFVALWGLVISPILGNILPFYYLLGIFLVTTLFVLFYRILNRENKYWPYLYLWQILNTFFFSYIILYAAFKIKDRGWGTR